MSEYAYAALLLHSAKREINEENVRKVLEAAGIQPDEAKIKALVASLEGVNIDEILQQAVTLGHLQLKKRKRKRKRRRRKKRKRRKAWRKLQLD